MTDMPIPLRLKILIALTEQLKEISPENNCYHDVSEAVFRGRVFFGDTDPLPMVAINEPPTAIERLKSQTDNPIGVGEWDILIQGWVPDTDTDNQADEAYVLEADIVRFLVQAKQMSTGVGPSKKRNILGLGDTITEMNIGSPVVRPPDEISIRACCYILLTLKIREDMAKPFE